MKLIKRDPKVQIKKENIFGLLKNRLPNNYQSKIGFDSLTQNVFLKEIINLMGAIKVHIDIQLKLKISRIEYLESSLVWLCNFIWR